MESADARMVRWIDLNDPSGARLKLASIMVSGEPVRHLFITNLAWSNPRWRQAVNQLGFREAPSRRYLVRRVQPGERISPAVFSRVFPAARLKEMRPSEYILGLSQAGDGKEAVRAQIDLRGAFRLGRNPDGHVVYETLSGRFYIDEDSGKRVDDAQHGGDRAFLRLPSALTSPDADENQQAQALAALAHGLVRSLERAEPIHDEDLRLFVRAAWGLKADGSEDASQDWGVRLEQVHRALDEAVLQALARVADTPALAYGQAARWHAYRPQYRGAQRGTAALPLPLAIAAQRLLGNASGKRVVIPNVWDGALAAFLAPDCEVRAFQVQPAGLAPVDLGERTPSVQAEPYSPMMCAQADGLLVNLDPRRDGLGWREDFRLASQSLRHLPAGARAVLLLAGDEGLSGGHLSEESRDFLRSIAQRYVIDDCWEAAPILMRQSGADVGVRLIAVRAQAPTPEQFESQLQQLQLPLTVLASWDEIKAHIDERIEAIALQEAQSRQAEEAGDKEEAGDYQRPYMAFSRLGEARTMVPANLQTSVQQYLSRLESLYGPVDDFVASGLGMGKATLAKRFSPEQIDGIATMLSRILIGRSSILADDTGIGKGRQLAALAVWANKRGEDVYFVTDRANLFSDLARDLNDIGEWGRFSALVFNADGEITVDAGVDQPPRVLARGEPTASLRRLIDEDLPMSAMGRNICFLTYSQIAQEESDKARWLKNRVGSGLVIFDEAHIAAGSDSNIARHVAEIAAAARHVQFASATWAKTPDNLHIYQRAFPQSVSVATLADTMRKGGESFSETFSGMLAADGALIRREHDLSRLEVDLLIDEERRERNEAVSDKIADVLGAAAYLAGEMEQVFIRTNADSVRRLREARLARSQALPRRARLFTSNFGSGSVIYQVMKGVQGALNAEHVAQIALESLRRGLKPVIVSDATGESLLDKMLERDGPVDEGQPRSIRMPTLQDLLRDVLVKRLTTVRVREVDAEELADDEETRAQADADAQEEAPEEAQAAPQGDAPHEEAAVVDVEAAWQASAGPRQRGDQDDEGASSAAQRPRARYREVSLLEAEVMTPDLREIYERGMAEIEAKIVAVPPIALNAIDVMEQMLRDAGYRVGEITGRKHQMLRAEGAGDEDRWLLQSRLTNKRAVKATIKAFNDGRLDALVINRSAAAGVSLHASPRFADRSRRHLIEHMIPEDPVNRVQLLGRVNRYDQVSSPLITTASTGIYGEVRYLMMQNRKLARLSANVRSSRDNAMALKGVVDLFNPVGHKAVLAYLQDSPLVAKRLGFEVDALDRMPDLVNRVTMRIPLLTVAQQRLVYEEIYSRFDEILLRAEMDGYNPLRPEMLDVRGKLTEELVFLGEDSSEEDLSAFDAPVYARRLSWSEHLRPLAWKAVLEAVKQARAHRLQTGEAEVDEDTALAHARVNADGEEFLALPDEEAQTAQDALQGAARLRETAWMQSDWLRQPAVQAPKLREPMPALRAEVCEAVRKGFEGLKRLAVMSAGVEDERQAASQSPAARRALVTHQWVQRYLHRLVPGAGIHWSEDTPHRSEFIITDVAIPESRQEWMHLGKWKITLVGPGDERGRVFSLRSLLSEVDGVVVDGAISGQGFVALKGPQINDGVYGRRAARLSWEFDTSPAGLRRRDATLLCGNLYLASEWAAATGKGRAVIYTDEHGARHRGILLPRDMEHVRPEFLPVRLAEPASQAALMLRLMRDEERPAHVLDLTFKSAMKRVRGSSGQGGAPDAILVLGPGHGIGLSMAPQDLKRVAAALRSAQKAIQKAAGLDPAEDEAAVKIEHFSSRRRGMPALFASEMIGLRSQTQVSGLTVDGRAETKGSGLLLLHVRSEAQLARAVRLLSEHAGLEIYAADPIKREMAREALSMTMRQRREEMRQRLAQARADADAFGLEGQAPAAGATQAHEAPESVASAEDEADDDGAASEPLRHQAA